LQYFMSKNFKTLKDLKISTYFPKYSNLRINCDFNNFKNEKFLVNSFKSTANHKLQNIDNCFSINNLLFFIGHTCIGVRHDLNTYLLLAGSEAYKGKTVITDIVKISHR